METGWKGKGKLQPGPEKAPKTLQKQEASTLSLSRGSLPWLGMSLIFLFLSGKGEGEMRSLMTILFVVALLIFGLPSAGAQETSPDDSVYNPLPTAVRDVLGRDSFYLDTVMVFDLPWPAAKIFFSNYMIAVLVKTVEQDGVKTYKFEAIDESTILMVKWVSRGILKEWVNEKLIEDLLEEMKAGLKEEFDRRNNEEKKRLAF